MFCLKCSEAIPDGSDICPICGAELKTTSDEKAVIYASQANTNADAKLSQSSNSKKKIIVCIILSLFVLLFVLIGAYTIAHFVSKHQKEKLKEQLIGEWYIPNGSVSKVLIISEDTMKYRLETDTIWLNTTVGTYDWRIKNKNTIEIDQFGFGYKPHTIKISEGSKSMTITPAITSTDALETWYYSD